jgi:alpha-galactosidase
LIDRLRNKHANVEIESCSSGGARADYGVLERADRIWTSDSNDALDRQMIQRGASFFFPLSVIGAHVGPRECHITGRVLSMGLRAGTAMFGHMGVEANLLAMSDEDRADLKDAFALYKKHRALIHDGTFMRLDGPPYQNSVGVASKDRRNALFSYAMTGSTPEILPDVFYFAGLDPDLRYSLRVVWPTRIVTPPPHRLETSGLLTEGYEATGDMLMNVGLQLPLLHPDTCLVFEATAI